MVSLQSACNRVLDAVVKPEFRIGRLRAAAFHVFGVAGFVLAVLLACSLALHLDLSVPAVLGLAALAVCVFLSVAMARKVVTGNETLVYYHHQIAVLFAVAVALHALGRPMLPYLDVVALALGLFLAFGRLGCLFAGCCHGAPHALGVRYGDAYVAEGFPVCFAGVRMFPAQLLECLAVLMVVAAGTVLALTRPPGAAFAHYLVFYGAVRFLVEFTRGDEDRPYLLGLSQPQWISILQIVAVNAAELTGRLPFSPIHLTLGAGVTGLALVHAAAARSFGRRLVHPRHATEIAEAVCALGAAPQAGITAGTTSLGIRISAGMLPGGARHFAFSRIPEELTETGAHRLAGLVLRLHNPDGSYELRRGGNGVFHVLSRGGAQ